MLVASLQFLSAEFEEQLLVPVSRLKSRPVAALELMVDLYLDPEIASPRKVSVWYAFWGEASSRQEYYDICGQKDESFAALVRELIERLIVETSPAASRPGRDSAWAHRRPGNAVAGLCFQNRSRYRSPGCQASRISLFALDFPRPICSFAERRRRFGRRQTAGGMGLCQCPPIRRRAGIVVSRLLAARGTSVPNPRSRRFLGRGAWRRTGFGGARRGGGDTRISQQLQRSPPHIERGKRRSPRLHSMHDSRAPIRT